MRPLLGEDGEEVLDEQGEVVKARHVKRDGEWVPCDSPQGARQLVRTADGKLYYAGQALVNQTCAQGQCHHSAAEGELRSGAPEGLDFELPLAPLDVAEDEEGTEQLETDAQVRRRLSVHQRRVYDDRQQIWKQVDTGRMPPGGVGSPFRGDPGLTFVQLDGDGTCEEGEEVGSVVSGSGKQELGVWLACGSPVVEASDERVTEVAFGTVGNIVPACDGGSEPGTPPTFDTVYAEVLGPQCGMPCHNPGGIRSASDFSSPQAAFDNLVNVEVGSLGEASPDPACPEGADIYVVPGDPDNSYLLHKMDDPELTDPFICAGTPMPPTGQAPIPGVELVRRWIEAGAPAPGEPADGAEGSADGGM